MQTNDVELMRSWQKSPRAFIRDIWGLTPQPDNGLFVKGKHITWQQDAIIQAVEDGINNIASRRITVKSGHGIGKTTCLAWIIIWFICCFEDAQIPCTAPTADTLFDVLWKELAAWKDRMPTLLSDKIEWSTSYLRIKERPETWFARAKTARKESPEALAGIHGEHVLMIVDEASGVCEEIFRTAEGALTNKNVLLLIISNPTRLLGYFYDSHHSDKEAWQCLGFSCLESPIVDNGFVERIKDRHGEDSDEFKIRVLGQFPKADSVDDKGFVPLFVEADLHYTEDEKFVGDRIMGVDPAGEGSDEAVWVIRDHFKARIVAREKISTGKTIAQRTMTLMDHFAVEQHNVIVDAFGVGVDAIQELAFARVYVKAINVGIEATDSERFLNKRAEAFQGIKDWLRQGGELVRHEGWKELLSIRYRRELSNKVKIMGKLEMRKEGIKSPNIADALMLTFADGGIGQSRTSKRRSETEYNDGLEERFAKHAII